MASVPHTKGIMAINDQLSMNLQLLVVLNGAPAFGFEDLLPVMVSDDQVLLTVEPAEVVFHAGLLPDESKVSEMVHSVVSARPDLLVPRVDQGLIHLIHVVVRTTCVFNNVRMAENAYPM